MSMRFWRVCSSRVCQGTEVWEPRAWVRLWTLTVSVVCPCQLGGPESYQPPISLLSPAISQLHAPFLTKLARIFSKREHDWSVVLSWNKCSVYKYAHHLWISLPPLHHFLCFVTIFSLFLLLLPSSSLPNSTIHWSSRAFSWMEMDWEFGISRCKLLHTEWRSNKVLHSTGNYIQYLVIRINHNGKEYDKEYM